MVDIGVLVPGPSFRAHTPICQLLGISVHGCVSHWELPSAGGNFLMQHYAPAR